ncbi:MAG: tRNA1(Val) (adenine(37)-N6)-methyltransferase [Bacilli bacterium]|nr:tRNA1(Val) (adenine(37)-N6)-methyltransferase [Bacilli bacterium]
MERMDDILGYPNLKIYQDSLYFSFSLDSIVLANYSTIRHRDHKIIDFCTGNGVIPLILSRRCDKSIEGVEIQEKLYDLACRSVAYNQLEDRIHLTCQDVKDFSQDPSHLNQYDLVLCNPPYFPDLEESTKNLSYEKRIARHEILIDLDTICDCAKKVLKEHGNFCMIHRADRLMDILSAFRNHDLEPKRVKFIHEKIDKESFLVLVEGQRKGSVGLKIDKPLILYQDDGSMTDEYQRLQVEVIK